MRPIRVLEAEDGAAAEPAVGGDHGLAFRVVDPVHQGRGREAAEDDGMHRADAGAGQHGDGQLGDHGQVEGHGIALPHPMGFEDIGELADLAMELEIGQGDALAHRFPFPEDRHLVLAGRGEMPVEAIVGEVGLAAFEPFGERGDCPSCAPGPIS